MRSAEVRTIVVLALVGIGPVFAGNADIWNLADTNAINAGREYAEVSEVYRVIV